MVNFNNDTTITTPPGDILKIAILERRAYFINAIEEYMKFENRGGQGSLHVACAGLFGLFLEVQSPLKKDLKEEEFAVLKKKAEKPASYEEAIEVFTFIDSFLYTKNLTRFDTRREVDNDDIEGNNKAHGL